MDVLTRCRVDTSAMAGPHGGAQSKPFAAVTALGVLVLIYAGIQPPFDILINYAVGLVVLLLALWFGVERRRFKGPPVGGAIAGRQAGIAAAETAVATGGGSVR